MYKLNVLVYFLIIVFRPFVYSSMAITKACPTQDWDPIRIPTAGNTQMAKINLIASSAESARHFVTDTYIKHGNFLGGGVPGKTKTGKFLTTYGNS